jgi:hypothetical protein
MTSTLENQPLPPRLLTTQELAEFRGCGENTLEQERLKGKGVPYIKFGKSVRYDWRDVEAYIAANRRRSTSENPGRAA